MAPRRFWSAKGATQEQVRRLDMGLLHLARRIEDETGLDLVDFEGIGAAGGFALPFVAFAKAKLSAASILCSIL